MKRILLLIVLLFSVSVTPAAAQAPDPRTDNAKAFHVNSNSQVDGIELVYQERPWTAYQLVQARLVDEASSGGNTVAKYVVVDCYGTPISENVYLAWAWPELIGGSTLPGNQNSEHMIVNGFSPPAIGPLAIYVGDSKGAVISDVIGGLGLPFKRHVSFYLAFRKRCAVQPTVTPTPTSPYVTPTPTPVATVAPTPASDMKETNDLLRQVLDVLRALAKHLGVSTQ